jgi:hypothetical protein
MMCAAGARSTGVSVGVVGGGIGRLCAALALGITHLFYFGRSDDYLILRRRSTTELHLSRSPDRDPHDPHRTAGSIYLRVTDTQSVYDSVRAELARVGALYLAPESEDRSWADQRSR